MIFSYLLSGVEKKNDDFRRYFHRKINRWDAATNLLLIEKRQESLRDHQRIPRKYLKRNNSFWNEGGKQEVASKVKRISTVPLEARETHNAKINLDVSLDELKKMSVSNLISLLETISGQKLRKKSRKQDVLDKILSLSITREG